MRSHGYRSQRTIARPAALEGVGFLTGATVRLRFVPAPPSAGVVFVRTDLRPRAHVPAVSALVTSTERRTTLGRPPAQVGLVEHVLAALAGLRIDNCYVELDAPEPPGLDGSSRGFVDALLGAGVVTQPARRPIWSADLPLGVERDGATLTLYPAESDELKISYLLDYGWQSPIGRPVHTHVVTPGSFAEGLAGCRTFLLEEEALELRRQGLGARTTEADLLVFGPGGPRNNRLRFADEPARHKVLDLIGDLALFGHDVRGHLVAYRSGHLLNVELVRALERRLPCAAPVGRMAA